MSIRMGIAMTAGLVAAAALAGNAAAQATKPVKPKTVTVTGCATQGVPQFCIRLGGFNVSAANPAVPMDKMVRLTGTVSDNFSFCSGTPLLNISWMAVSGKCKADKGGM
jgi:hypothetical protein